jgi:hypothetical protein
MKTITKYIADDGMEFINATDCAEHEHNLGLALGIMSLLPKRPESCDFSNGNGYIQHDKDRLLSVRNDFLEFCKRYSDHKWIQETIDKGFDAHPSWAGRILSECLPRSIYKHWHRLSCIDNQFREWGQPYYADHPEQAKNQSKLN